MKKILVLLMATSLSYGVFAQTESKMNQDKMKSEKMNMMHKDYVLMKDNKMMVCKNGKTMDMNKDMMLKNGATVMMDGTVKMKDGKSMKMKNGEEMDMNGKVMWMKSDKMMTHHKMMKDKQ